MSSIYILVWTSLRLAMRQLVRHKVRSFLTMLGILIGIGSVVAIVSLGEGLRAMFVGQIATQANAELIWVMPDAPMQPGRLPRGVKLFNNHDISMINESDYIIDTYGVHMMESVVVKHGWRSERVQLVMANRDYFPSDGWVVEHGRMFLESEDRARAMVCLVAAEIDDTLYDEHEALIGSYLQINGQRFEVIGEMEERSAMEGGSTANKMVFVPLSTGQDRLAGTDDVFCIAAQVRDTRELQEAKEDIATRLRASRRIRSGADDDFQITTTDDWANFANGFVNTLITVFGIVAVIALLVGGIGVMNIMLVNVRERTREIGLRKALGATAAQITWQFLVESMTLTTLGGILGILIGYALGLGVALIMKSLWDVFWWPSVPLVWIIAVVCTGLGLGLAFGVYPAWRAGLLNPIDALRYE